MVDDTNFENSQELAPDAEVILFRITTNQGANIYIKSGPPQIWQGNTYESLPCGMGTEQRSVEGGTENPSFSIGGDDIDLAIFKPGLFTGELDNGTLTKYVIELDDLLADLDIKNETQYRIKQVRDYSRLKINLILGRFSPSAVTTIPHVKYTRPAFPNVQL